MHFCFRGFFCYDDEAPDELYQEWLFSRRWMTWSLFQKYVTRAYEKYHKQWYDSDTIYYYSVFRISLGRCEIRRRWKQFGQPDVHPPKFSPSDEDTDTVLPYLSAIQCHISPKLLHGPFTPDKLAFLRFLTANPIMVQHTIKIKRHLRSGWYPPWSTWHEALMLGNYELLSLLLSDHLIWAVRPTGKYSIKAVEEYNSSRPILKLLIEKIVKRSDYDFSDLALADCVGRASDRDRSDRCWLFEWIQRARDWQNESDFAHPRERTTPGQIIEIKYLDSFTLDNAHQNDPKSKKEQLESEVNREGLFNVNEFFFWRRNKEELERYRV
ncbi:uncharacterized protein BDZ99DRAFT_564980 [Mytilinidion resinicola]|uniref:Uncharacterized protein n=1 Tax=Mytilinidion resinicola TaxID=574789 RepID=A0A6A6ZAH6_9PEZI|nr:uncharacterized protein BDZ99DRAFT_564980 [Mytilinidion resinicola]KAF2817207.1 hypothetical protein BDZ99DRAFT_564980 [Mytilinidion resinicola]